MDKSSLELASQGLEIFNRDLTPEYIDLRERLSGALSVSHMAIESTRHETEQAKANHAFVQDFITELPGAQSNRSDFMDGYLSFTDGYYLRMFQGSVLWFRGRSKEYKSEEYYYHPGYVVGMRSLVEDPNISEVLLARAKIYESYNDKTKQWRIDKPKLAVVRLATSDLTGLVESAERLKHKPVTKEDVEQLHDFKSNKLKVTAASGGSFRTGPELPGRLRRRKYDLRDKRKRMAEIEEQGELRLAANPVMIEAVSDEDLANFGVFHCLNKLAMGFDEVEKLKELIAKRAETARPSLTTQLVEGSS